MNHTEEEAIANGLTIAGRNPGLPVTTYRVTSQFGNAPYKYWHRIEMPEEKEIDGRVLTPISCVKVKRIL